MARDSEGRLHSGYLIKEWDRRAWQVRPGQAIGPCGRPGKRGTSRYRALIFPATSGRPPLRRQIDLEVGRRARPQDMSKQRRIRIAHQELLDYLNACKRLRTRRDKVEL